MNRYLGKYKFDVSIIIAFVKFTGSSFYFRFNPGIQIFKENFRMLMKEMFLVLPAIFIQAGPLYSAFPVAYILWKKGCSPANVFIYLSAFTTAKIPMLTFEIGFLGLKFSWLRVLITIPVFIIVGLLMGRYFKRNA